MIDLRSKALPKTIMVDGRAFPVKTDYRVWLQFEIDISRNKPPYEVGYLFDGEIPKACSVEDILAFARPKDELPRALNSESVIALDYLLDADYIYAAFLGQYGIDLVEVEHLHWHKFLALIKGLNSATRLHEIMGYRCYKKADKNEDIYERLRWAWEIDYDTPEEQEQTDAFSKAFTRDDKGTV